MRWTMTREQAEHFLPRVAGERCDDTGNRFVEIRRLIDDNGILAPHFGNDPFDHWLSWSHTRDASAKMRNPTSSIL